MKFKPYILFWFLLSCWTQAASQTILHVNCSYSPTVMFVAATGNRNHQHRWGHQLIGGISWTKSPRFSTQAGIGYSFLQAEYQFDIAFSGETLKTWYRHQDLIFPLEIKYAFSSRPNRFYGILGIVPSVNIGRKVLETRNSISGTRDATDEQYYDRFDMPLSIGAGYGFSMKSIGHGYIQPTFRTNLATEVFYFFRYLFGRKSNTNDDPPAWSSLGMTLGFAW
ncbi:MAG TPA: hypothetical protein DCF33_03790 [Saprospirales bacterium]|nr:hypothetical protein [Saprospirales bacterium]